MADSFISFPLMPSYSDVIKIKQTGTPYSLSTSAGGSGISQTISITNDATITAWYCEFCAQLANINNGPNLGPFTFIMPRVGSMHLFNKFYLSISEQSISLNGNSSYVSAIVCTSIID